MNDTETEARYLLAAATEDRPPEIDLLDGFTAARRRDRRRRTRARILLPAGATTAAAAASVVALTLSAAPPALATVTSALTRTLAQSYRTAITSDYRATSASSAQNSGGGYFHAVCSAETDLTRNLYSLSCSDGFGQREVGGNTYYELSTSPHSSDMFWVLGPPKGPAMGDSLFYGIAGDTPQQMLAQIKQASNVSAAGPASGPGWTGTKYTFTENNPPDVDAVSGTVEVDQQGRARVLALTIASPKSDTGFVKTEAFTFSDFGGSVTVTPPPLGKTSS